MVSFNAWGCWVQPVMTIVIWKERKHFCNVWLSVVSGIGGSMISYHGCFSGVLPLATSPFSSRASALLRDQHQPPDFPSPT